MGENGGFDHSKIKDFCNGGWQPLKSIRNENLEYIKNSCKSDKTATATATTTKHTEQAIHRTNLWD